MTFSGVKLSDLHLGNQKVTDLEEPGIQIQDNVPTCTYPTC